MSVFDVAAREAEILGKPPRILPLAPEVFGEDALALCRSIDTAAGVAREPDPEGWVAIMLRNPSLFRAHTRLAVLLMAGAELPARDRELAVLRTGWLCRAPFEWSGHVDLAKRIAGISSADIEKVTIGSTAPGWAAHDAAVLRAVEEMLGNAMIADDTWAVLAQTYNDAQLIELPLLVGQYLGVAYAQNSMRVPISPIYGGLTDR